LGIALYAKDGLFSYCFQRRYQRNIKSPQAAGVPVLVFAAGLGDSISAVLKYHKVPPFIAHIFANFLKSIEIK
jgi:hypothetical protein